MELTIRALDAIPLAEQPVEVVERKGLGHPDTICDALAEHVCVRLCRAYRERFGAILHHNVDKLLLCGGASQPAFGGGRVVEPIEIDVAGRATRAFEGSAIPVDEIAVDACREWLQSHLPALDAERHVRITPRLRPGSSDLAILFAGRGKAPLANDTSCGAGFAPLTELERVVLAVEGALNGAAAKRAHPEIGTDVKVMGVRRGARIELSIGCAFVDRFVADAADYLAKKEAARALALEAARRETACEVDAVVNAADDVARGGLYLTVTGTSAEAGDDGETGRGNRASGLITPYRAMTLEAAAGKNPVTHVGKLYNVAAGRIAAAVAALPEVREATCVLVSRIGSPIDEPQLVDVRVVPAPGASAASLREPIGARVRAELGGFDALREALLEERVTLF